MLCALESIKVTLSVAYEKVDASAMILDFVVLPSNSITQQAKCL
jgi:hypothetical protein